MQTRNKFPITCEGTNPIGVFSSSLESSSHLSLSHLTALARPQHIESLGLLFILFPAISQGLKRGFVGKENMDNRWIVGVVIISLFLGGCGLTGGAVSNSCTALSGSARDDCFLQEHKCSSIRDPGVRDSCVVELAKAKGDISVCNLIQKEETRAYCQEQMAFLTDNQSLCQDIRDRYWKDNCHFHFATQSQIKEMCAFIGDQKQRFDCFLEVALAIQDPELCDSVGDRESCVFAVAKESKDTKACSLLTLPINKDACVLKIAKITNDPTLCQNLSFAPVKENCDEFFAGK